MKTAGLVLDFYDDRRGEILKSVCPTEESLPGCVKTAHLLSPDERNVLRGNTTGLSLAGGAAKNVGLELSVARRDRRLGDPLRV